jgi:hypothetical protein
MGWRAFFSALHIVQFVFILVLVADKPFVDPALYKDVKSTGDADVLNIAVQLGRLDLASMSLALVGLILAGSAIFAYFVYGHVVERTAKRETGEIAPAIIAKILRDEPQLWVKMIRENPELMRSALRDARLAIMSGATDISERDADAIAAASAEDGNGKHDG